MALAEAVFVNVTRREKALLEQQGPTYGALLPIRSAHSDDPTASRGNRCYVSSSESPHERQCTAHSLAVSRNILTMKSVKKAFVRAQPMRSTTNTTLKARRSNEKPLHTIFRATFI